MILHLSSSIFHAICCSCGISWSTVAEVTILFGSYLPECIIQLNLTWLQSTSQSVSLLTYSFTFRLRNRSFHRKQLKPWLSDLTESEWTTQLHLHLPSSTSSISSTWVNSRLSPTIISRLLAVEVPKAEFNDREESRSHPVWLQDHYISCVLSRETWMDREVRDAERTSICLTQLRDT